MSARSRFRLFKFPVKNQLHRFTRSKFGSFLFFAILISGGLFSVLPLVYCITTSFKPLDELLIFPPTLFTVKRPTIANYTAIPDLLSGLSVPITRYAFNSIFVSIIGTFLSVIISAMAAFVLSKTEMKFNKLIFTVVQFSLLFNAYTLSVPQYIVYSKIGIINTYLAYIVPAAASSMGVFLMKQYMDGYVPYALIEAAPYRRSRVDRNIYKNSFTYCKTVCFNTCNVFVFGNLEFGALGNDFFGVVKNLTYRNVNDCGRRSCTFGKLDGNIRNTYDLSDSRISDFSGKHQGNHGQCGH